MSLGRSGTACRAWHSKYISTFFHRLKMEGLSKIHWKGRNPNGEGQKYGFM